MLASASRPSTEAAARVASLEILQFSGMLFGLMAKQHTTEIELPAHPMTPEEAKRVNAELEQRFGPIPQPKPDGRKRPHDRA